MIAATPDIERFQKAASQIRNGDTIVAVATAHYSTDDTVTAIFDGPVQKSISGAPSGVEVNTGQLVFVSSEWTRESEARFAKLARLKALGQLELSGKIEFEKLAVMRRSIHPRSGEEIIAEYEQRVLTDELVTALQKYVEFHKQHTSHRQGKTS